MQKRIEWPFFLTKELAEEAIKNAVTAASKNFPLRRKDLHVVMLVQCLEVPIISDPEVFRPEDYVPVTKLLCEISFGNITEWEHDFKSIARCKSIQVRDGRNPGAPQLATPAHLLLHGDTPFWGADKTEGIITACSGVQPWFDRGISRTVNTNAIALAHEAKEKYMAENGGRVNFLGG